jgi:hypothetical protein
MHPREHFTGRSEVIAILCYGLLCARRVAIAGFISAITVFNASPSRADLIFPGTDEVTFGIPGNTSTCVPFGCGGILQQAFSSTLFDRPIKINAVFFFTSPGSCTTASCNEFGNTFLPPGNLTITFAISNNPVGSLSSNTASNVGSNSQIFWNAPIGPGLATPAFGFSIPTAIPYIYDPSMGDLLMTLSDVLTGSVPFPANVDANNSFSGVEAVVNGSVVPNYGLVTEFLIVAIPEPSTLAILITALVLVFSIRRRRTFRAHPGREQAC